MEFISFTHFDFKYRSVTGFKDSFKLRVVLYMSLCDSIFRLVLLVMSRMYLPGYNFLKFSCWGLNYYEYKVIFTANGTEHLEVL